MGKYKELAAFIVAKIGGKENVGQLTHCMTRLRFTLKEANKVEEKELLANPEIITAQWAGGKYQVVIGTHVGDVYEDVLAEMGNLTPTSGEEVEEEKKGFLNKLIDIITKVITPALGILTVTGLIQGLTAVLVATNVLSTTDGAYIVLNAMGNALFQFFPVILGYTSAEAFKMNKFVGMLIGAVLVFPNITTNLATGDVLYTLFKGSIFSTPIYHDFFNIPIMFPANGYASTVIPIIFAIFVAAKIEKFLKKNIPDIIGFTLVPFITLLVAAPISILVVGPIANFLSQLITFGVSGLYGISPIITAVIVALIYQPLVILGLHWPLITIGMNNFGILGYDYIVPMIFTASFAQTAVVCAVYCKTKSAKTKAIAIPAIISGLFCIIEPAIYGITLPVKKRFAFSMIGGAIGGAILSAFSIKMYAMSVGVLGLVSFVNPNGDFGGLIFALVAVVITMLVSFLLTYFTFNENPNTTDVETSAAKKNVDHFVKEEVVSPLKGRVAGISESEDYVFAQGILGKGVLIYPTEGKVVAPCNGIVTTFFPTGHAIGLTSDRGEEMLIHIGRDTVQLEGKYFYPKVQQDARVKEGDVLLEFDLKAIEKAGFSLESPVIITNSSDYFDVIENPASVRETTYLKPLLTLLPLKEQQVESLDQRTIQLGDAK